MIKLTQTVGFLFEMQELYSIAVVHKIFPVWETNARPLANVSENLAG